jgi:ABC-type uncharacterized transport system ATPase subunit
MWGSGERSDRAAAHGDHRPRCRAHPDRITVLDQGMLLAEGNPHEIAANRAVQVEYLGKTG